MRASFRGFFRRFAIVEDIGIRDEGGKLTLSSVDLASAAG